MSRETKYATIYRKATISSRAVALAQYENPEAARSVFKSVFNEHMYEIRFVPRLATTRVRWDRHGRGIRPSVTFYPAVRIEN